MILILNTLVLMSLLPAIWFSSRLLQVRRDFIPGIAPFWIILLILGFVALGNILEYGKGSLLIDRVEEYLEILLPLFYLIFIVSMVMLDSLRTISDQRLELSLWNFRLAEEVQKKSRELDQSYRELVSTRMKMMQKDRSIALGRMIRRMAHLINTPLGNCVTSASLLKRPEADGDDFALAILQRNLRQISGLIREVRALADLNPEGAIADFNLEELVRDMGAEVTQDRYGDPEFLVEAHGDMQVSGYRMDLKRIFREIVDNAFEHNPDIPQLRIRFVIENSDDKILIRITDNGQGIPATKQESIFDPLSTSNLADRNLGMGLFMVRNILQTLFDGDISLERGEDGTGSFVIRIPTRSLRVSADDFYQRTETPGLTGNVGMG